MKIFFCNIILKRNGLCKDSQLKIVSHLEENLELDILEPNESIQTEGKLKQYEIYLEDNLLYPEVNYESNFKPVGVNPRALNQLAVYSMYQVNYLEKLNNENPDGPQILEKVIENEITNSENEGNHLTIEEYNESQEISEIAYSEHYKPQKIEKFKFIDLFPPYGRVIDLKKVFNIDRISTNGASNFKAK